MRVEYIPDVALFFLLTHMNIEYSVSRVRTSGTEGWKK